MKEIILIKDFNPIDLTSLEIISRLNQFYKVNIFVNSSLPNKDEIISIIKLGLEDYNLINQVNILNISREELLKLDSNYIKIDLDNNISSDQFIKTKYEQDKFYLNENFLSVDLNYIDNKLIQKGICFYTSISILKYITEYKRYFALDVIKYLSKSRYEHVLRVANISYKIALSNNIDPYKAYQAGYFHDLTRNNSLFLQYKDKVDKKYSKYFPKNIIQDFMYHQFTCEYALKDIFNITDEDIYKACRYHTSGYDNMSKLDKVVFVSDKIEPGRDYPSSYLFVTCLNNIEDGFKAVLKANKDYLESREDYSSINQNLLTIACYKHYLN